MPDRPFIKRAWYDALQVLCRLVGVSFLHVRCSGRENQPRSGGVLVLSNHQSHLDPVLIGVVMDRRVNPLGRDTLFKFAPLRWIISSLNTIPIDREGIGLSGLKETLRRIKQQQVVLIFPEGTRSRNGEVGEIKPGFAALAKRVKVPLLPIGIDGAFQAWPRSAPFPHTGTVHLHIGAPLMPDEAAGLDDRALVAEVERRIRACHAIARRSRERALGQEPAEVSEPTTTARLASLAG